MSPAEIGFWTRVAEDLRLDIVAPCTLDLPNGARLVVSALVRHFGRSNGMVVDESWSTLKNQTNALVEAGYGFSRFSGGSAERYNRSSMIEVLADWDWRGPRDQRPRWLPS